MSKVVVVDNGSLMFRSIFAWASTKSTIPTYTYLHMLIASLKRLELTPDDTIIIAVDSPKGSWRKDFDCNYKANRKDLREQQRDKDDIPLDWTYHFQSFNRLISQLEKGSPFITICIDKIEADDIMAYAPVYFKDKEVILVSPDSDIEMLVVYPNVKVFSNISKKFKDVGNPYKLLASKIEKETCDNLITPIITKEDLELRTKLVNLMVLPEEIQRTIKGVFESINWNKSYDVECLPFKNTVSKMCEIYNNHTPIEEKKEKQKYRQQKLF